MTSALEPRPFYETAPLPGSRGTILLLSYHFPPGQGAGALRWQKLSHHVVRAGWALDVVTAEGGDPSSGRDRLAELPAGVRVYGAAEKATPLDRLERTILSLRRMSALRRSVPALTAKPIAAAIVPDRPSRSREQALVREWNLAAARRAYLSWSQYLRDGQWAHSAYRVAAQLVRAHSYSAIITCGPPHLVHVAGRRIATLDRLPFVMDLRDPWSLVERVPESVGSPVWFSLAKRAESRCVEAADLVLMNTSAARDAMQKAYSNRRSDIIAVMNGWDSPVVMKPLTSSGPFRIAYAGAISLDRTPDDLFRAAAALARSRSLKPGQMELLFIGPKGAEDGSDIALNAAAREHGVDAFLRVEPFLPRHDSLERLAQAHVMVSFYQDSKMAVPSKVFEYLTLPGRVLAFATRSCATAQVLENTGAEVVDPGDHAAHREALERLYDAFLDRRLEPISPPMMLRREAQASLLVDALEQRLGLSARAEEDAAASPLPEVVR